MNKNSNCIFCNIDKNLKIYEAENFYLHFDPYPLVAGHLMISSKSHYNCLEVLPNNIINELSMLKLKVRNALAKAYKVVSFYAQGRTGECIAPDMDNCLCHHFHLYALPFAGPLHEDLELQFRGKRISDPFMEKAYFGGSAKYLYFEDWAGNAKFYSTEGKVVPHHFLRTLILRYLGEPYHAGWKVHTNCGEKLGKKFEDTLRSLSTVRET